MEQVRARLPELPDAKRDRFINELGLPRYDASVLVADQAVAHYYEGVLSAGANPKAAANWILVNLFSLMNRDGIDREAIGETKVSAEALAALLKLLDAGTINRATAVDVLGEMWETGEAPNSIVERKGLAQISDAGAIEATIREALAQPDVAKLVAEYLGGKDKVFGAIMGKTMAALGGKGNPQVVRETLTRLIEAMRG